MDYNKIVKATIEVFRKCNVHSFPIDCEGLLIQYGYRLFSYRELQKKNPELYTLCLDYSEDAFRSGSSKIIAYNTDRPEGRIRFSLMHELGHHVLEHASSSKQNEKEANAFASYILAPRMSIHYAQCKNANDVAKLFGMSFEAAENAYIDYRKWHRKVVIHKMTILDKAMYTQFYDPDQKCFVWSKKTCDFCGRVLYNSYDNHCHMCKIPFDSRSPSRKVGHIDYFRDFPEDGQRFMAMEQKWLYDV